MARPSKLTPERQERIVLAIRGGNFRETAARFAGIGETTLYRWMAQGRKQRRGAYADLVAAIEEAEAAAEIERVQRIQTAARNGNWTADAWWLERKNPQRWGRRDRVEHRVITEDEIAAEIRRLTEEMEREGIDVAAELGPPPV
jgi:transposase-like protein